MMPKPHESLAAVAVAVDTAVGAVVVENETTATMNNYTILPLIHLSFIGQ